MPRLILFAAAIVLLSISCRPTSDSTRASAQNEADSSLLTLILEKIGPSTIELNSNHEYAIGQAKEKNPMGTRRFIIVRVNDLVILKQGSYKPGYIKWLNDDEIELFDAPEIIRENEDLDRYKKVITVSTIPKP